MANRSSGDGGTWTSEQLNNARVIAQVGRSMGMSSRDIQIALMTALQESGLRNLDYGDRDSLGLFQQRPSAGWGSPSQVRDPVYASRKFYQGLSRVSNRNSLELWQAAQKVQISAFPRAYAKWESSARGLLGQLGGADVGPGPTSMPEALPFEVSMGQQAVPGQQPGMVSSPAASPVPNPMASAMDQILQDGIGDAGGPAGTPQAPGAGPADEPIDWAQWTPSDAIMEDARGVPGGPLDNIGEASATGLRGAVLNMARQYIGTPYVWGGSSPNGFDCSGFTQYVLREMGVSVPRLAYQQANFGKQTSIGNLQPGDLVFWGNSKRNQGNHIAFYLGNGQILEAPRPGLSVRIRKLGQWDADDNAIGVKLDY